MQEPLNNYSLERTSGMLALHIRLGPRSRRFLIELTVFFAVNAAVFVLARSVVGVLVFTLLAGMGPYAAWRTRGGQTVVLSDKVLSMKSAWGRTKSYELADVLGFCHRPFELSTHEDVPNQGGFIEIELRDSAPIPAFRFSELAKVTGYPLFGRDLDEAGLAEVTAACNAWLAEVRARGT
jgi:hypothetical protein